MRARNPHEQVALGATDRFLVPRGDRRAATYLLRRLRASHGLRERLSGRFLEALGGRLADPLMLSGAWTFDPAGLELRPDEGGGFRAGRARDLLMALGEAPEGVRLAAGATGRWRPILLVDYAESARGQLVVFPFPAGAATPASVVKVRALDGAGRPLLAEMEALNCTRARLRGPLAATVPAPLAYHAGPEAEVLVLEHLDGASVYAHLQNHLLPGRGVADHLHAAADWLSAFHRATHLDGRTFAPGPAERALLPLAGSEAAAWWDALTAACERHPLPLSMGHGDFWARNLLLAPDGATAAGVVDWEHSQPAASPLDDLLFFPVAYGENYPWTRYRRLPRPEAFRRTFFDESPVAHAVRGYLARYARGAELTLPPLTPFLRLTVLRRAARSEGEERASWIACDRLLAGASRAGLRG